MAEKIKGVLNRKALTERVAHNLGVEPIAVADTVLATCEEIARIVAGGGRISISNFGTFRPHVLPARNGRNPVTGELLQIPEITLMKFVATGRAKDMVRNGDSNRSIRKRGNK